MTTYQFLFGMIELFATIGFISLVVKFLMKRIEKKQ